MAEHSGSKRKGLQPAKLGPLQAFGRWQARRRKNFPQPVTTALVQRDLPVTMSDGVVLPADHWAPAGSPSGHTVLVRNPYGRDMAEVWACMFAEAGHHVVVQDCRGTAEAGGEFNPFFNERSDAGDTVAWLRAQPWYDGRFVTFGPSYLGLTQWALAEDRPVDLVGMVVIVSARNFREAVIYPGEGFAFETALTWNIALDAQSKGKLGQLTTLLRSPLRMRAATALPPADAIRAAVGHDVEFYRNWLVHNEPGDPYWPPIDFAQEPAGLPPVIMAAGWYDLFLLDQVADHRALQAAGVSAQLFIGPWRHTDPGSADAAVLAALHMLAPGGEIRSTDGVHLMTTGDEQRVELANWPGADTPGGIMHLTAAGALARTPDGTPGSLTVGYDPSDPTPSAGGRSLNPMTAGPKSQKDRESRDDVLVFTSAALAQDFTVIGDPVVRLTISGTAASYDLFVRLCDVDPGGTSASVTEGYRRFVASPDAPTTADRAVELALAPTGHVFKAGHQIRLQISGGAHPLHLRNPGNADPLHDFTDLVRNELSIRLGGGRTSALTLPVHAISGRAVS
ncbi:MAG: CocE/NonD family hydrolase [Nakamurella sp.]